MNGEIGTEAAQFPEKEYINGIVVAVRGNHQNTSYYTSWLQHLAIDLVCSKPRGVQRGTQDIKITAKYEKYTRKSKAVFYKVKSYL
jgi:hypothetical protein